tara:strand:+ start:648 stop:896 length:249 start_codon:yes stop_codon:yes gene_type:complete
MENKALYLILTSMALLVGFGYFFRDKIKKSEIDKICNKVKHELDTLDDLTKNPKKMLDDPIEYDSDLEIIVEQPNEINPKNE